MFTFGVNNLRLKRKFTTNLALLLALNLLVKPFWIFGIDRTIQNAVGPGEYGLFFALFNFSILLNIVLDFGLTNFNNREISQHPQLLPRYLSNMVGIRLILAVLYFIISFSAAAILGYTDRQMWMLLFLVFNQFLLSFILYLRSNLSALQLFKTDSILSVTDRVLMIALCSILLWTPLRENLSIEWFVYSQTIAYAATAIISLVIVIQKAAFFKLKFNLRFLISIFRQSYPYAFLVLLMSFHYRVDSVMLERLLPDGHVEAGIYAQAFRLLDASSMIPFLFASLLLPIFSRMVRLGEDVRSLLGFAINLLYVAALSFSAVCIVFRRPIMELLYVSNTPESYSIFALLMAGFVFISLSYIVGTLLTAFGNLRLLNLIALVGVVVNVLLNLYVIPRYQANGAALSSLVTQAIIAILEITVVIRFLKIKLKGRTVVRGFSFSLLVLITIVGVSLVFSNWIAAALMGLLISIVFAFALQLVKLRELISLWFGEGE